MFEELKTHFGKLVSLTPEEFAYVSSHFTSRKFRKHQFLVQQGSPVAHDFFVVKGLLKSSFVNEQGKEHILQLAMEDWWTLAQRLPKTLLASYLGVSRETLSRLSA